MIASGSALYLCERHYLINNPHNNLKSMSLIRAFKIVERTVDQRLGKLEIMPNQRGFAGKMLNTGAVNAFVHALGSIGRNARLHMQPS